MIVLVDMIEATMVSKDIGRVRVLDQDHADAATNMTEDGTRRARVDLEVDQEADLDDAVEINLLRKIIARQKAAQNQEADRNPGIVELKLVKKIKFQTKTKKKIN